MPKNYYVYSLKDPRKKPAEVFYIGKGTGSRATDHLKKIDETRKGRLIQDILASGQTPIVTIVIDKSIKRKVDDRVTVPKGAIEKAQLGLKLLKDSITLLAEENLAGITNSDCAHYLGLQSDNEGSQQDYLTYSVLGLLMKEGTLANEKINNRRIYFKIPTMNQINEFK